MTQTANAFRTALAARDLDTTVTLLSDDVVFRCPLVFKPCHRRDAVRGILATVFRVVDEWRCVREIGPPSGTLTPNQL